MLYSKNIVFVNPPVSMEERYGKLSAGANYLPPLGLCHLAAIVREKGFDTRIIDCVALQLYYEDSVDKILRDKPKIVGITASTISIYNAAKIAELIKAKDRSVVTIIGGPHVTSSPEETMKKFPQFDLAVIGEGEITIIDLLEKYYQGCNLDEVDGIVFRRDNGLKFTNQRAAIKNLDLLPMPAWDLLPYLPKFYRSSSQNIKTMPSTSLVTSRGCPGQCTFCDRKVFGNYCRSFSSGYVIKMIETLYFDYGIRDIQIKDDNFTAFRNRLVEVCKILIEKKINISWSCLSRVDNMNPEILSLMKKAGCWQIQYGIESGSQEIIDVYKKAIKLEQVSQTIKWTKEADISPLGLFIIGSPLETEQTMLKTIVFAKSLDLDDFRLHYLTPFPGSELYETANKFGTFGNDWKQLCEYKVNFIPNGLTREIMEKYYRRAYLEFYCRPKIFFAYLKRMRNIHVIFGNLKVAYFVFVNLLFNKNKKYQT